NQLAELAHDLVLDALEPLAFPIGAFVQLCIPAQVFAVNARRHRMPCGALHYVAPTWRLLLPCPRATSVTCRRCTSRAPSRAPPRRVPRRRTRRAHRPTAKRPSPTVRPVRRGRTAAPLRGARQRRATFPNSRTRRRGLHAGR